MNESKGSSGSRGSQGILSRLLGGGNRGGPRGGATVRPATASRVSRFDDLPIYYCCMCGTGLGEDPDNSLHAEGPNRHICGNCYRSREWDAILEHEFYDHHQ